MLFFVLSLHLSQQQLSNRITYILHWTSELSLRFCTVIIDHLDSIFLSAQNNWYTSLKSIPWIWAQIIVGELMSFKGHEWRNWDLFDLWKNSSFTLKRSNQHWCKESNIRSAGERILIWGGSLMSLCVLFISVWRGEFYDIVGKLESPPQCASLDVECVKWKMTFNIIKSNDPDEKLTLAHNMPVMWF